MEFKTTNPTKRRSAFTIVEVIVAGALSTVLGLMILTFSAFAGRSFAAMTNYWDLDRKSRSALDQMSRDIRRCNALSTNSTTRLVFLDHDGTNLTFQYSPSNRTLVRIKSGATNVLLSECDSLTFYTYQRTPVNGSYEQFTNSTAATCKLVQLEWICSRTILGNRMNTESVQSAKIVMRKR